MRHRDAYPGSHPRTPLVRVRALSKSYARELAAGRVRRTVALESVSLDLRHGEIAALCGSEGAGKTTLLQCVAGVRKPDCGRIEIESQSCDRSRTRARVAFVTAAPTWYPFLTVRDVLENHAARCLTASGSTGAVRRSLDLLDLVALSACRVSLLGPDTLTRVALAEALLGDPHVVLIDTCSSAWGRALPRECIAALETCAASGAGILVAARDIGSVKTSLSAVHLLDRGRLRQNSLCVAEAM